MQIKIQVPTSQSEITLGQYQKYLSLVDVNKDDEASENFLALKMLEVFCYVPYKETLSYKYKDILAITQMITEVLQVQEDHVQRFNMGKVEMGFIPKLDDMSFGEFIDLENNMTSWETMHKAMAVLYRPITESFGERYRIEDYEGDKYAEIMKEMPLNAAFSSLVFFWNLGNDLQSGMMKYFKEQEEKIIHRLGNSQQSGDGITQFTKQLKEMLETLKVSLN
jgi:hypothetical protein